MKTALETAISFSTTSIPCGRMLFCIFLLCSIVVPGTAMAQNQDAVIKSEFIFQIAPFPSCHASTIAETKSGLVAAWFGGTAERNPDVCIYVSRMENGHWTPPM